ncbi:feruloyl-CoA synthetase [Ruegeria marisrubri]|uniref:Feruloyl-CoA synthetase n=1 Tax=Ruegeria marisrubri TaxID=1685379 RepID=A0A0X3TBT6_9RHOB|nr:feruloyl-CoA synthase [Ruegeria marisrubri]KUJ73242.1 feruloyl-CoA synthetase [Ruegeria marisrubri]
MAGYVAHDVIREDAGDGVILLRSAHPLPEPVRKTTDWLHHWANERPDAVFLAERSGPGWRELRYGEALEQVRALAAGLLARGLNKETPILILSGNSITHGLLSLAAQYVGIPTVPVAEQYSLIPGALKQLHHVLTLIDPAMVFAEDGEGFAAALSMEQMAGRQIVVGRNAGNGMSLLSDLMAEGADIDAANARVGPDTVAKILMTSGSTSAPKGVVTTQAMLCANQAQYEQALPFLSERPPRLVDWLPWNHVFGGSNNFNQMLAFGGALYIDGGKPLPALIGKTFENNRLMNGTIAYNVPVGYARLRDEMRRDERLKRNFFADLDMLFYAGASLAPDVWQDLSDMAQEVRDEAPLITTCWGMTETAPACIFQHFPANLPGIVGVPLPGITVKLVPEQGDRYEVRVKGPNIFPGYYRDPEKTAEAFDEDGFFCSGDAMALVDPEDVNRGLRFAGRMSEDFKLASGIWVRAAALRLELLVALAPLAADVVITGEGRTELGVMIVPTPALAEGLAPEGGALLPGQQAQDIAARLAEANGDKGSSARITRALILSEPPSMAEGEITAKGNLNFRKLLDLRAAELERLYSPKDPAVIFVQ